MEQNSKIIESLLDKTTEYIKLNIELFKLKLLEKGADVVATMVPQALVFILMTVFILFVNVGLALWLGEILGEPFYGFLTVAGFYLLLSLLVRYVFFKGIKKNIADRIVQELTK